MGAGIASSAEDDLISVGEETAGFAGGQGDGFCAIASEFEKASCRGGGWTGDGSGGEDVADLEVAAVAGVVGEELGWGPVEVLCVGLAQ